MEFVGLKVLQVGDELDALFDCLENDRGMNVTSKAGSEVAVGDWIQIDGDWAGVTERLRSCNKDWDKLLEPGERK